MVQGQGHGVDGEVPPFHVFLNGPPIAHQVNHQRGRFRAGGLYDNLVNAPGQVVRLAGAAQMAGQFVAQALHRHDGGRHGNIHVVGAGGIAEVGNFATKQGVAEEAAHQISAFVPMRETSGEKLGDFSKNGR